MRRLEYWLRKLVDPSYPGPWYPDGSSQDLFYTRVDLVWQFAVPPQTMVRWLRISKHPSIHKDIHLIGDGSILLPGTKIQVASYCKRKQMKVPPGPPVTRLEVRFMGKDTCAQAFGSKTDKLERIAFQGLYPVYRSELSKIQTYGTCYQTAGDSVEAFLARLDMEHPEWDVVTDYLDFRGLSRKSNYTVRKKVTASRKKISPFDIHHHLPTAGMPKIVEVSRIKEEQSFQAKVTEKRGPHPNVTHLRKPVASS